jgi:hypothetical protein
MPAPFFAFTSRGASGGVRRAPGAAAGSMPGDAGLRAPEFANAPASGSTL